MKYLYTSLIIILLAILVGGGVYFYQNQKDSSTIGPLKSQNLDLQSNLNKNKAKLAKFQAETKKIQTTQANQIDPEFFCRFDISINSVFTYMGVDNKKKTNMNFKNCQSSGGSRLYKYMANIDTDFYLSGDLNKDGKSEYILVFWFYPNSADGANFPMIIPVSKQGDTLKAIGNPVNILNESGEIDSASINNGEITIKGRVHSSDQARYKMPNKSETQTFKLVNDQLVMVK